jgi:L-alanine-DL-glutamate epimerase-like enolase superfamily enzyme
MRLEHEIVTVRTRTPFVIARGGASEWRLVWVRIIDDDGAEGWGEAAPSRFYGETTETVISVLDRLGGGPAGHAGLVARGHRGGDAPGHPLQRVREIGGERRAS